jgi:hypothetical protein
MFPTNKGQVFNLAQSKRESNVHHHGQADDLRRNLEVFRWIFYPKTLCDAAECLKPFTSDNAIYVTHVA